MHCNFLPGHDFEQAENWLRGAAAQRPRASLGRCLSERLPERLALALVRWTGCDPTVQMGQLTRMQRRTLLHALIAFPLPVERDRGWNFAEVTAGGVPLEEIDYRTMESRRAPGLYLVGEMLDCDGRIGGFNFQWAWSSGCVAGRAAAC
jgi:predicted Rossmann fold flavoprotein